MSMSAVKAFVAGFATNLSIEFCASSGRCQCSTTTTLPLVLAGTGATVHTGRVRRSARTAAA